MFTIKMTSNDIKINKENGKIVFTRDHIEFLPEYPSGPLIEIIFGDLFLVPSPSVLHQQISANLEFLIRQYLKIQPIGKLFDAPIDVILSAENNIIPDLVFIKNANLEIIKEKYIEGVPDLIIEILSTNRKQDLLIKKQLYETFQVPEYWIVDPVDQSITIYSFNLQDQKYDPGKKGDCNTRIESQSLEGFDLSFHEIFSP